MKKLLILIWVSSCFLSFSQSDTLNRTDKFGKKYGYWKKYNNQKKLEYEGMFYNGEPIGEFTYYHPNGKPKNISFFATNTPIVTTTMFHENGSILAEGNFYNKEKDGKWVYYNLSKKIVMEENYNKGKKQGISKVYDQNGKILLEECNWSNNKKHGRYTSYYTTGSIRIKMYYNQGIMHGLFENYYENGKTKTKGQYAKDFRKGKWITYNEKGREEKIEYFDQGICTHMFLGFRAEKEWIILNVNKIAYFYQKSPRLTVIQLHDSSNIVVSDNIQRIAKSTTQEYFIFINKTVLTSYEALKKVIPNKRNPDEAKIILSISPPFDVITYGDYYKLVKTVIRPRKPKLE